MYTSALIKLLSKLDKNELKRFDKFVHSPYFNTNQSIIQLFEWIKKYHPNLDHPKLAKEKIFQKLFPDHAYEEKRMWRLMSTLKGLVEQFLVIEKNDKDSTTYHLQLKDVYLEKDLYDWFEQKTNVLATKLMDKTNFEVINELYLHQIHDACYFNNHSKTKTPNHPSLIKANTHLQYYFHLQQLRYACEWVSRSHRIKEDLPLFVQSITYRSQYEQDALYTLYYKIFLLFTNLEQEIQAFRVLINELKNQIDLLPKKHQIILLMYLLNYGIKKLQASGDAYMPLLFELYQLGLAEHRLIYKGKLSEFTFLNIVDIASKLAFFDWIDTFIEEFQVYLPTSSVDTSIAWAKGVIEFQKGNYLEAISLFEAFTFDHEIKELARRSRQLRACLAYFLTGKDSYFELIINKSLSFEKYLMRKDTLTMSKRVVYLNLNRAIRKLAKLIYKKEPILKFDQLSQEVLLENKMAVKEWLLQQIQKGKIGRMKKTLHSPKGVKPQRYLHQ